MAADKETVGLSRVHVYESKCVQLAHKSVSGTFVSAN